MHFRERLSLHEIARRTGLSRNTVRHWLRRADASEPKYPKRAVKSLVDPFAGQLRAWLEADRHRTKRERRTARMLYQAIRAQGYGGGYGRVCAFVRRHRAEQAARSVRTQAFVPLRFEPGEAFQFDWCCEYARLGTERRRLEVAHVKLAASRVFWLVAYFSQAHEMLFDAHARAFEAFGGIPRRGIYDNMKTAVDRIDRATGRTVNARFEAMCGHYLFEPDFCNRAAGWEKGIVEKNVQDRRRQIWAQAAERSFESLKALNDWLGLRCREAWETMRHPGEPSRTIAELWREEQPRLMPLPKPFDGYIEQPLRVSATALITFQRNRYSVPAEYAHRVVSLRIYPGELVVMAEGGEIARLTRCFERDRTIYDFRHYLGLIERKPGALRNGAPFAEMPQALQNLSRQLLRHPGGDRVMVQLLAAIPRAGLAPVVAAAEEVLKAGRVSGEQVLNVLSRLTAPPIEPAVAQAGPALREAPRANAARYDALRTPPAEEVSHEH